MGLTTRKEKTARKAELKWAGLKKKTQLIQNGGKLCVISGRGLGTWWIKMEGGSVRRNIALKLKEPASIPSVKTQPVGGE